MAGIQTPPQPFRLAGGAVDGGEETLHVHGLGEMLAEAGGEAGLLVALHAVAGHAQAGERGLERAEPAHQHEATSSGSPMSEMMKLNRPRRKAIEGLARRLGVDNVVAGTLQQLGNHATGVGVVLDEQDAERLGCGVGRAFPAQRSRPWRAPRNERQLDGEAGTAPARTRADGERAAVQLDDGARNGEVRDRGRFRGPRGGRSGSAQTAGRCAPSPPRDARALVLDRAVRRAARRSAIARAVQWMVVRGGLNFVGVLQEVPEHLLQAGRIARDAPLVGNVGVHDEHLLARIDVGRDDGAGVPQQRGGLAWLVRELETPAL